MASSCGTYVFPREACPPQPDSHEVSSFQRRSFWFHSEDPCLPIPITQQIVEYLAWWLDVGYLQVGLSVSSQPLEIHQWRDLVISGTWSSEENRLHISQVGIYDVLSLLTFQDRLICRTMRLMSDVNLIVACIKNQEGQSPPPCTSSPDRS